jgi:hypothetical protein
VVIPDARKSKISETQRRCPRIHGFPKQTLGSMLIRASNSFLFMGFILYIYIY